MRSQWEGARALEGGVGGSIEPVCGINERGARVVGCVRGASGRVMQNFLPVSGVAATVPVSGPLMELPPARLQLLGTPANLNPAPRSLPWQRHQAPAAPTGAGAEVTFGERGGSGSASASPPR